ncbi:hypothetical protein TNCV_3808491 [Trichonephila clavipes]|nr:hypothetical protein TNCV_3808491 [Trichonephila clavipes]
MQKTLDEMFEKLLHSPTTAPSEELVARKGILTLHYSATPGFWVTDLGILKHGQVTRTTPELETPSLNFHTTPTRSLLSFDRFNVHVPPTRRVFSGTRLELRTAMSSLP